MSALKETFDFVAVWAVVFAVAYALGHIVTAIGG